MSLIRHFIFIQEYFSLVHCLSLSEDQLESTALSQSHIGIAVQAGCQPGNFCSIRQCHGEHDIVQRLIFLLAIAFCVITVAPLGQPQRGQKNICLAGAFVPAVQNIRPVPCIHLVFEPAVDFGSVHIACHIRMVL